MPESKSEPGQVPARNTDARRERMSEFKMKISDIKELRNQYDRLVSSEQGYSTEGRRLRRDLTQCSDISTLVQLETSLETFQTDTDALKKSLLALETELASLTDEHNLEPREKQLIESSIEGMKSTIIRLDENKRSTQDAGENARQRLEKEFGLEESSEERNS